MCEVVVVYRHNVCISLRFSYIVYLFTFTLGVSRTLAAAFSVKVEIMHVARYNAVANLGHQNPKCDSVLVVYAVSCFCRKGIRKQTENKFTM